MASPPAIRDGVAPLICHVIYRLDYGGLENGLVNLINTMPQDRYRHAILCLTHATSFRERLRRSDVSVLEAHKRGGKDLACYARVWRLVRSVRPHIVHTRNLPAVDMVVPARLAGVRRIVHSEHGLDAIELDGRNRKYNALRRSLRPLVSRYIALSADLERWLGAQIRVPASQITRIYNGVDTTRFHPDDDTRTALPEGFADDDSVVLGTVGRLEPVKDQLTFAQAFVKLLNAQPELRRRLRLVIIGEGPLRAPVEEALAEGGVNELCWLPGFRDEVPEIYRSLDLFVLPSRREGISNTLLEAMASGVPVVATAVGGTPEIVADGEVGKLVAAQDPAALAAALGTYARNRTLRVRHGQAARQWVLERFSMEAMVRGYLEVYDALG